MTLSASRWHVIAESSFAWEREALEWLRTHLPDRDSWHVHASTRTTLMPRTACLVRCSFSTSPNRTYSSPPSPNPIPGETATFASRSNNFENSSDPMWR